MKIIVAGSRSITAYETVEKAIEEFKKKHQLSSVAIVSGCARGVDRLGEQYARKHKLMLYKYPAEWDRFGKRAGYLRNTKMANNADALIAIWDGKSRGTGHMIQEAKNNDLLIEIYKYEV
jgi:hypothetical protein